MKYLFPKRIIASQGVDNVETLLKEKTLQIGLNETECAVFKGKAYVILDFGEELSGGARIFNFGGHVHSVRLRFGESVSETCAELGRGFGFATNDHSLRDFTVTLQMYSDMTFGQTGFLAH